MEKLHLQITVERKVANIPAGAKFGEKVHKTAGLLREDGSLAQKVVGAGRPDASAGRPDASAGRPDVSEEGCGGLCIVFM